MKDDLKNGLEDDILEIKFFAKNRICHIWVHLMSVHQERVNLSASSGPKKKYSDEMNTFYFF